MSITASGSTRAGRAAVASAGLSVVRSIGSSASPGSGIAGPTEGDAAMEDFITGIDTEARAAAANSVELPPHRRSHSLGQPMTKTRHTIRWLDEPEEQDYPAALSYLELSYPPATAKALVQSLRKARVAKFKAKD